MIATPIRLALVEDSAAFAAELCEVFKDQPDVVCVATCPSAASARTTLPRLKPDVVLVDLGLPDASGAELIRELAPQLPETDFVVLTVFDDDETISQALRHGASGYVLKRSGGARIVGAVREVHRGGVPLDAEIAQRLLLLFRQQPKPPSSLPELGPQENRLLRALAEGASVKEAAAALGVTHASARTYVRRIYAKLGVRSRTEATRRFLNLGRGESVQPR